MSKSAHVFPQAWRDVADIGKFLGRDDADVGLRFMDAAEEEFDALAAQPYMGGVYPSNNPKIAAMRAWRVTGFRKNLIFYTLADDGVNILRVIHGSRDIEALLG